MRTLREGQPGEKRPDRRKARPPSQSQRGSAHEAAEGWTQRTADVDKPRAVSLRWPPQGTDGWESGTV